MLHKTIFTLSNTFGRAARKEYKKYGETRKSSFLDAIASALLTADIALYGSERVMSDSRKMAVKAREKAITRNGKIIVILFGILCSVYIAIAVFAGAKIFESMENRRNSYPILLQVVSCEGSVQEGFTVKLKNSSGFIYTCLWEDGDLQEGDFYSCIMDTQGTACIYDDTIIKAQYTRVDLY